MGTTPSLFTVRCCSAYHLLTELIFSKTVAHLPILQIFIRETSARLEPAISSVLRHVFTGGIYSPSREIGHCQSAYIVDSIRIEDLARVVNLPILQRPRSVTQILQGSRGAANGERWVQR